AALAHLRFAHAGALLDVGAGAEHGAGAAHEYHAHLRIGGRRERRAAQLLAHLQVERVARLRAIQADGGHARLDGKFDGHFSSERIFAVCSPSVGGRPISGLSQPRNLYGSASALNSPTPGESKLPTIFLARVWGSARISATSFTGPTGTSASSRIFRSSPRSSFAIASVSTRITSSRLSTRTALESNGEPQAEIPSALHNGSQCW